MNQSLFYQVKRYFNSVGVGNTTTGTQFYDHASNYENQSHWKGGDPYVSRTYRSLLHKAGFLRKVKHNLWQVLYEIPDFITVTDLEVHAGYKEVCVWNDKKQNSEWRKRKYIAAPVPASHPELYGKAPEIPILPTKPKSVKQAREKVDHEVNIEKFMDHVLDTLETLPSSQEIEQNLQPRHVEQKFDNEVGEFIETGTYLLNKVFDSAKNSLPKGQPIEPINMIHGSSTVKPKPYAIMFEAKPGDLVYYIEFNKVCSSLIHEISMVWTKGEQRILYKTSHGQYPAERIFLTKQELINSL